MADADFVFGLLFGETSIHTQAHASACVCTRVCMHALNCGKLRKFRQGLRQEAISGNQTSFQAE